MKKAFVRIVSLVRDTRTAAPGRPGPAARGLAATTHVRAGRFITDNKGFVPFARAAAFLDAQARRAGRIAALLSRRS